MNYEDEVEIEKVRKNGIIIYDIWSILNSTPAKRHLKLLHNLYNKKQGYFKEINKRKNNQKEPD